MSAIEDRLRELGTATDAGSAAKDLLVLGEEIMESWLYARGETPTDESREGFRLLALHRQGAKGDPSFNACRESCRELVYRYNVIALDDEAADTAQDLQLMSAVATHIYLFVSGKLQEAQLGDFCCSSRPLQSAAHN